MNENIYQCDLNEVKDFLLQSVSAVSPQDGTQWLREKSSAIFSQKEFYLAFSAAPRFVGKEKLHFSSQRLEEANFLRKNWNPTLYTVDRAARIIFLLSYFRENDSAFVQSVRSLITSADIAELAAIYSSLPLLPFPEEFVLLAAEGVRSNMRDVFDAIALENPYPADFFSENAWNQLVLKAIFINRPLFRIIGIDERVNKSLCDTLIDYVHERWAAGRTVTPELWRCVVPFVDEKNITDIHKLAMSNNILEQKAAALVCTQCNFPEAKKNLITLQNENLNDSFSWNALGKEILTLNP